MNIYSHLLIDLGILSAALTITLVLRAKSKAARKEKEIKWFQKKNEQNSNKYKLFKVWKFLIYESFTAFGIFRGLFIFHLLIK